MVFTGENVQAEGYRSLQAAGLGVGQIGGIARAEALPWRIEEWDRTHPAMEPFNDPQYGDLRRPTFQAYTRIQPDADAEGRGPVPRRRAGRAGEEARVRKDPLGDYGLRPRLG